VGDSPLLTSVQTCRNGLVFGCCPAPHAAARLRPTAPSPTVAGPQNLKTVKEKGKKRLYWTSSGSLEPETQASAVSLCSLYKRTDRTRQLARGWGDSREDTLSPLTLATQPSPGTGPGDKDKMRERPSRHAVAGILAIPAVNPHGRKLGEGAPIILRWPLGGQCWMHSRDRCWVVTPGSISHLRRLGGATPTVHLPLRRKRFSKQRAGSWALAMTLAPLTIVAI
jgi:hypothetical protein